VPTTRSPQALTTAQPQPDYHFGDGDDDARPEVRGPLVTATGVSRRRSVLVVEDEEAIAEAVRARLSSEGYEVSVVHDGPQAIRSVAQDRPDLVVLDLMLPGMDGLEVCREIQKRDWVPVLMLTARADEAEPTPEPSRADTRSRRVRFGPGLPFVATTRSSVSRRATSPRVNMFICTTWRWARSSATTRSAPT